MSNIFNSIKWIVAGSVFKRIVMMLVYYFFIKYVQAKDFGTFNEFTAFLGIISIVSFISSEYLIFTKGDESNKKKTMFQVGFIGFLITSIIIFLFSNHIGSLYKNSSLSTILTLSPLILFIEYLRKSLRIYFQKEQKFKILTHAEILNTIVYCSLFCLVLPFKSSALYLVTLYYIGNIFELIFLIFNDPGIVQDFFNSIKFKYINSTKLILRKERKFITITTLSHTFGVFGDSSPILLLGVLINSTATGIYALTNQLIATPIQLVLQPIEKVFFSHLARLEDSLIRKNIDSFTKFCVSFIWLSWIFAVFLLHQLIEPIFPDKWAATISLIIPISTYQAFRFLIVPISSIPIIKKRTDIELWFKILSLISRAGIIFLIADFGLVTTIYAYSLVQTIMYLILYIVILKLVKSNVIKHFKAVSLSFTINLFYICFLYIIPEQFNLLFKISIATIAFILLLLLQNKISKNQLFTKLKYFIKR